MSRSFTPGGLVQLPRLTAITAGTLLQSLITAANEEEELPGQIAEDRDELIRINKAHQAELIKRQTREGEVSPEVKAADVVEDNAFGALVDWVNAFKRLPPERHPEAAQAAEILATAFEGGLKWLTYHPRIEWQEAETRLAILKDRGFRKTIKALGGQPFLDEIDHAHEAYGKALGITERKETAETHAVGDTYAAAIEAIRTYVLTVSASVRKNKPGSADLAARLLAPITEWRDTSSKSSGESPAKADGEKKDEAVKHEDAGKVPA